MLNIGRSYENQNIKKHCETLSDKPEEQILNTNVQLALTIKFSLLKLYLTKGSVTSCPCHLLSVHALHLPAAVDL